MRSSAHSWLRRHLPLPLPTRITRPAMAQDARVLLEQTDADQIESATAQAPAARGCMLVAVGSMAGLAAAGALAAGFARADPNFKSPVSFERAQFPKPNSMCSTWSEDCAQTGCCQTTGQKCWAKDSKSSFCKQDCPSDWDCADLTKTRDADVVSPGTSLYCYSLWFSTKGGKSKVPDDELLAWQLKNGKSIFACQAWDVFSDVPLSLSGKYDAIQLKDEDGDWYAYTREDTGAAANAAIHVSAWKVIRGQQKWRDQEWVVKADADAVFIPQRLQDLLARQKQPYTGIYYENCKGVDSGFFGSLEVISTLGFKIFVDKLEVCKSSLAWDGNPSSGWKYGPWGEDKFAQECMDKYGVLKLPLFELTYDGTCPSDRPKGQEKNKKFVPPCWNSSAPVTHPLKSVKAWAECLDTTLKVTA